LLKQLLLRNCAMDFVEICNFYNGKTIIKAAKRIFNSDKMCRSCSDLNFGVTFLEHSVILHCFRDISLSTGVPLFNALLNSHDHEMWHKN